MGLIRLSLTRHWVLFLHYDLVGILRSSRAIVKLRRIQLYHRPDIIYALTLAYPKVI